MKAIILAGGQGLRLGSLTAKTQKAVLPFQNKPLITHIIERFLLVPSLERIVISTGYLGEDLNDTLQTFYSDLMLENKLKVINFPEIRGTLSRLVATLSEVGIDGGYYVCGIDSLIPPTVFTNFHKYVRAYQDNIVLCLSPLTSIAPTHGVACVSGNLVVHYVASGTPVGPVESWHWLSDVGIWYLPKRILHRIVTIDPTNKHWISEYIQELVKMGWPVRSFIFQEPWRHFAFPSDFASS